MDNKGTVCAAVLLVLQFYLPAVYCGSHTLHYHITVVSAPTPGVPQYSIIMYVDGVQYGRYNSDIRQAQSFSPSLNHLSEHLEMQTKFAQTSEVWQRHKLNFLMGVFNKTKSNGNIHIYQRKCACELHDDGTIGGYQEIAFDGKDFLVFDKEKVVYVPVTHEAVMVSHLWNKRYDPTSSKKYMETDCIQHMEMYLPYISTDLEKKVPPKVKVSSSESESGTKLHCRVYGFYPRDVEVKWIKNGRDEIHSEEAAQILPNPDGTYQIRVSVGVTPEGGATYSCHIDHSSLEKTLVVPFEYNNRSILYIIIPICAALLLLMIGLGLFLFKKGKKGSLFLFSAQQLCLRRLLLSHWRDHVTLPNQWKRLTHKNETNIPLCEYNGNMAGILPLVCLIFSLGTSVVYSGSHTLRFHVTKLTAPYPGFPDYMLLAYVDDLRFARYNNELNRCEFWIPALGALNERITKQKNYTHNFKISHHQKTKLLTDLYNKTSGKDAIHVYQTKSACVMHEDGTISAYQEVAFNGKELIAYDYQMGTFIPTTPEAQVAAQVWNEDYAKIEKVFLENFCTHRLSWYLPALASHLEKLVPPKVKVSISESDSGAELHCRVYGFYPRDVEVKWIKNGRDEIHSEEAAQILPNPDGTYQIRVSVGVTPEGGATYSCHVEHSSLEKTLVVPFEYNNRSILYIIIPICGALLLLMIGLGLFLFKKGKKDPNGSYQSGSTEPHIEN
uniref:Ig-like domain-containing protein n=1 Tax=Xenopus tropicalis TaxID=8364 RepID=A0A803K181_XENTR